MAPAKTLHGARAQLVIGDPNQGQSKVIGIFNNVSYGVTYAVSPVYLLGRFTAAETVYTGQELVNVSCSGFRLLDHGAHVDGKLPALQELMGHEYITLTIFDRQSGRQVAHIKDARPVRYSGGFTDRSLATVSIDFVGILVDDETVTNAELPSATRLPD